MATNASTWFYAEPEHRAYLLEERVNHTFWSNRIAGLYLDCVSENPPFRMSGDWNEIPVTIEWVPNDYFTLITRPGDQADSLIVGVKEILGFTPAVSYVNPDGELVVEWRVKGGDQRLREVQNSSQYRNVKRYKG
jgi:hypothetical protein